MKHRTIIGLCGAAGAGKDAVGKILCESHGFTRVAFADRLKVMALDRGWSGRKDDEGRRLLQDLGMEYRNVDPTYWIVEALRTIDGITGNVVITDCRFLNELETIEDLGGAIWRIERPDVGAFNDHVSEHEWRLYDGATIIHNDGSLEDLARAVASAMES